jgi:sulfopyruvate decarboxylase TPP-binding subunit
VATTSLGLSAERVLATFKELGFTHVIWLPDTESGHLYQALADDPDIKLVQVCREGESMGIALGLTIGGQQPVCLIQNTGFYESGDSIRGIAIDCELPLLIMIGYRGWQGGAPMNDSAGKYLEPILDAWEIPHYLVESDADLGKVGEAWQEAQRGSRAVAVLVGGEYES